MASKVVVQDVTALANYVTDIQDLKHELENTTSQMYSIFDNVRSHIAILTVLTKNQKANWRDPQYDALCSKIQECINAVNSTTTLLRQSSLTINTKLADIQQSIEYINKLVAQLRDIDTGSSSYHKAGGYTKHLSPEETASRWELVVQSITEQIDNYRTALNERGVPNGKWLDSVLASQKAAMLEQEAYELDVASGHEEDSIHSCEAYHYPGDYSAFYDQLAGEFRTYCAQSTNPNYDSSTVTKWCINCQRCVPTYELLRRGLEVTALPCDGGFDFLSIHPFSVWNNANIISCTGQDQREIESAMSEWGDGARAQVVVMWTRTSGHTFVAEQRNGHTYYIDPQSGNENYVDWVDSAIPGMTQFCRIDNLESTSLIEQCYMEV